MKILGIGVDLVQNNRIKTSFPAPPMTSSYKKSSTNNNLTISKVSNNKTNKFNTWPHDGPSSKP